MKVTASEYQDHPVFDEINFSINFYSTLSDQVFNWITQGTQSLVNMDTYIFSLLSGTLDSICLILRKGRINDAWALMRKYYDFAIINIYTNLYLEKNYTIENFVVDEINDWTKGKKNLPSIRRMLKYIMSCSELIKINELFDEDDRYIMIRRRCNDHYHFNCLAFALLNDNQVLIKDRIKLLDLYLQDFKDIFLMHLVYLFAIKYQYMSSSDYVDYMDCGQTPPDDSQYWVAPFVQNAIDRISKYRPEAINLLKEHTCMHLQ